jgi:membrane-associated phospholipid phosphatase/putative flippase GtrA
MESIHQWGVEVVLWLQQFSPGLDLPFRILTSFGGELFFLVLIPLLYWCVDRRTGARLSILFLLSAYVNAATKVLASQPRPFDFDPQVRELVHAGGGGFPSGHTQNSVVFWGYLAAQYRRPWFWTVAVLFMGLVPLSRMYLGVHFPTDLLGGYLLGGCLLLLYLRLEPVIERWLTRKGPGWHMGLAVGVPVFLTWVYPGGERYGISACATLMGMAVGFVLERRWVGFDSMGTPWKRMLRFALGEAVLFGLWLGLKPLFSGYEPEWAYRFLRHLLLGFWGGFGAPWVFVKLGLSERSGWHDLNGAQAEYAADPGRTRLNPNDKRIRSSGRP